MRTGKLKLVFRNLDFVGPDSERLAKIAGAMALQDHLWQFVHVAFEHQGRENSGYATDAYLESLVKQVGGVDVSKAMADRNSPAALEHVLEANAEAARMHVKATPAFFLVGPDQRPRELDLARSRRSRTVIPLREVALFSPRAAKVRGRNLKKVGS